MFAAPCRVAAFALLAVAFPSPALATPYIDAVETAVFDLCPGLRSGRVSAERPRALTRAGYRRTPELEEDQADAEDGVPYLFVRAGNAEVIRLALWPHPQICIVTFAGREAEAAAARVRARLARSPRRYLRVPAADWVRESARHEAWQVIGPPSLCLSVDSPGGLEEPPSFDIWYQPDPPLQPAISLSMCDPIEAR